MNLSDLLSVHDCEDRPVFVQPAATAHVARLIGAEPARPDLPGNAVLVDLAAAGEEAGTLRRVAGQLHEQRVGVVLCGAALTALPVGHILTALAAEGVRLLGAQSVAQPDGGSALVVTRDESIPLRSHVLGQAVDTGSAAVARRRDNEYVLEGVLSRATVADVEGRLRTVEAKAAALEGDLRDEQARVQALQEALGAATQRADQVTAERDRLQRALRAARLRDPRELARRVAARSRRTVQIAGEQVAGRLGGRS